MALNLWSVLPPSWWPLKWWPFTGATPIEGEAVRLFNGIHLVHRVPPQGSDVRVLIGTTTAGIPVIPATDDRAGAIRIKKDENVFALQHY